MSEVSFENIKITGITFTRHIYMYGEEKHYFGYNLRGEVVKEVNNMKPMFFYSGLEEEFKQFLTDIITDVNILSWENEYLPKRTILDGEEWRITIHLQNDDDIHIYGQNAFPENFDEFIEVCNKYDFGPYFIEEIEEELLNMDEEWYDDFIEEINELESKLQCPKCSSDYIVHVDLFGYSFMCGKCGHNFEYEEGRHDADLEFMKKDHKDL